MSSAHAPRWYVITGAPSSGKTSLCVYLNHLGFRLNPETARLYIDIALSQGKTLAQIKSDNLFFQRQVLKLQVESESRISSAEVCFLDRSLFDNIAYGLPAAEVLPQMRFRYAKVFFLEPVGFHADYARLEDESMAQELGDRVLAAYRDHGFEIVRVPKMAIDLRAQFILNQLSLAPSS